MKSQDFKRHIQHCINDIIKTKLKKKPYEKLTIY